jgi:phage tail sheath gpL-like
MTIDPSAVARVLGITTQFKDFRAGAVIFLPQRIAVFAQGAAASTYSSTKKQFTNSADVGAEAGYGSVAHLIAREFWPENGDGLGTIPVDFFLLQAGGGAASAAGTITVAGTQTKKQAYRARIAGILSEQFVFSAGDSVAVRSAAMMAAINAVLHMPVIASGGVTNVTCTAKWAGVTGNDIVIEIVSETGGAIDASAGSTFALVQPTGGLVNPSLSGAISQVGGVWNSMVLNALNFDDTVALDALSTFGEGRWGELTKKPLVAFCGATKSRATITAVTSARATDRTNCVLVAPGSPNLPSVVAAAQLVRIARLANKNPPHDYGSQRCPTIIPGVDSAQWDYTERDVAVKGGSSTVEIKDGVLNISDVVTMWRPTGEVPPSYRFVVDIVKLQQVIFNLDLIFNAPEYDGAPFIPDEQSTTNPSAKKPKMVKQAACNMIDSLADFAIISDPKTAKKNTACVPNPQNPKRWDLVVPIQVSGNSNVKNIDLLWGFYYGAAA